LRKNRTMYEVARGRAGQVKTREGVKLEDAFARKRADFVNAAVFAAAFR
jgi:hypothetical protein